jgi:hypothetical protein
MELVGRIWLWRRIGVTEVVEEDLLLGDARRAAAGREGGFKFLLLELDEWEE